jgi:hypothetical protein
MERQEDSTTVTTTSWIPDKFAKAGANIRLKDENGDWAPWRVVEVGAALPEDVMKKVSRQHKNMRKMTDV